MKIKIISISRLDEKFISDGSAFYLTKLKHYTSLENILLKAPKQPTIEKQLEAEWQLFEKEITGSDVVCMLDDKGEHFNSLELSNYFQQKLNRGVKKISFLIGGAYGFHETGRNLVKEKISLSRLTLPHQLARLVFLEQLYRSFTILKNENYHHQ